MELGRLGLSSDSSRQGEGTAASAWADGTAGGQHDGPPGTGGRAPLLPNHPFSTWQISSEAPWRGTILYAVRKAASCLGARTVRLNSPRLCPEEGMEGWRRSWVIRGYGGWGGRGRRGTTRGSPYHH